MSNDDKPKNRETQRKADLRRMVCKSVQPSAIAARFNCE